MNATLDAPAIAEAGRRLYQEKLQALLEPKETGRYLVLNVEAGEFELGDDALTPSETMRRRFPNTLFFALRAGYPAMIHRR